ncbi:MAG: hypothetical protein HUN04_06380 [Desulfobacter sp.]|nr:MAG: hypothetical protein HUN04_06380 [Desulfobacter sp.]
MKQIKMFLFLMLAAVATLCQSAAADTDSEAAIKQQWAGFVNQDIGCLSLGWRMMGVNLTALGMVQDQSILGEYGFKFGQGPYRTSSTRIETGRYLVRLQPMSRPDGGQEIVIQLNTRADEVYPYKVPPAPEGKYTWNSAIQYDMMAQTGMAAHYEMAFEPVSFVDVRIIDPEKLSRLGFPGHKKNDTQCQLIYRGGSRWEFNPGGVRPGHGILVYEKGQWRTESGASADGGMAAAGLTGDQGDAPGPVVAPETVHTPVQEEDSGTEPPVKENRRITFVQAAATDMTYNDDPIEWEVFEARTNADHYYLIRNPDLGTALIDVSACRMFDAEDARPLSGGDGMSVEMNRLTRLSPSGADLVDDPAGKKVMAWWGKERLSFTLAGGGAPLKPRETVLESPPAQMPHDPSLLFENSDFEAGDLTNWTREGDAFDFQPTRGDNPLARGRKGMASHHQGDFWIGTYEKYQGDSSEKPGGRQGDRPTGVLTSVPFEIRQDKICFLIGGGSQPGKETVSLVIDGQAVYTQTGSNTETMTRRTWDVSAYRGGQGQIVISDMHNGGWGHINADDFRYGQ